MKFRPSPLLPFLTSALAATSAAHAATVLTFAGTTTNANIPATFGDNAAVSSTGVEVTGAGTPNIDLTWSATGGTWQSYTTDAYASNTWTTGVAQLDSVSTGDTFTLTFTPGAGFGVKINSFNFDTYDSLAGSYTMTWDVFSGATGGTSVLSGLVATFSGDVNPGVTVNFTATDSQPYRLVLTMSAGTGQGSYLAVDNISFDQVVVPEPSAALLGAAGLGAMALRRRRA